MLTMRRISNEPYKIVIETADIKGIANEAKSIPRDWINEQGNDIMPALHEYMAPLILGEPAISYRNGLPAYLPVDHLNTVSK